MNVRPVPSYLASWELPAAVAAPMRVESKALRDLVRASLEGLASVEANPPSLFSPANLGREGYACAYCVACQYDGALEPLLETTANVLEDLGAALACKRSIAALPTPAAEDARFALLFELAFYRGFAFARSGRVDDAERTWAALEGHDSLFAPDSLAAHGLASARAKADVERAVVLLNKGHYARALPLAEAALDGGGLEDAIVTLRGLATAGLCAVGLGLRAKVKAFFAREARVLETYDTESFRRARLRREAAALLAFEEFDAAQALVENGLAEVAGKDNLLEAFLRQVQVQLRLIRNQLPEAAKELTALERFVEVHEVNRGVLSLAEQRYELALRQRRPDALRTRLEEGLREALDRGDTRAQMTYFTFLARLHLLEGRGSEARDTILKALALCEKEGYGPDQVDCLFHTMGVGAALADVKLFREAVTRAGKLARKLDLHVKAACFEYVLSLTSPARERSGLPLVEILKFPKAGEEAYYYLDYYGFLKETRFEARIGGQAAHLEEKELRARILTRDGVWWFEENSLLLRAREGGVIVVELARSSLLRDLFLALINSEEGLSVERVHALTSPAPYHPLRHASKVKTLIHRLRAALGPAGLAIASPRDAGCYVLQGRESVNTVLALKEA